MTISVTITTFNRLAMLKRAIQSVFDQSMQAELVVVDDCSSDATDDYLASLIAPPGWTVRLSRNSHNIGHAASMNIALSLATGQWVKPLDDDDYLGPDCLRQLVDAIALGPTAVICSCLSMEVDESGREIRRTPRVGTAEVLRVPQEDVHFAMLMDRLPLGTTSRVAFDRSAAILVGGWDPTFEHNCDDVDLWVRLAGRGDAILINRQLVFITVWSGSYNHRFSIQHRCETNMVMKAKIHSMVAERHRAGTPALKHIRNYLRLHWAVVALRERKPAAALRLLLGSLLSANGWLLLFKAAIHRKTRKLRRDVRHFPLIPSDALTTLT